MAMRAPQVDGVTAKHLGETVDPILQAMRNAPLDEAETEEERGEMEELKRAAQFVDRSSVDAALVKRFASKA